MDVQPRKGSLPLNARLFVPSRGMQREVAERWPARSWKSRPVWTGKGRPASQPARQARGICQSAPRTMGRRNHGLKPEGGSSCANGGRDAKSWGTGRATQQEFDEPEYPRAGPLVQMPIARGSGRRAGFSSPRTAAIVQQPVLVAQKKKKSGRRPKQIVMAGEQRLMPGRRADAMRDRRRVQAQVHSRWLVQAASSLSQHLKMLCSGSAVSHGGLLIALSRRPYLLLATPAANSSAATPGERQV